MTVNSFYYQKPNTITLFPRINPSIKKVKRFSKNYLLENISSDKKGFIKVFWAIAIALSIVVMSTFIYFQSVNADLDYRITEAKNNLKNLEIENAELKTNLVKNISPDYIINWAQQNGFVKNNSFSYFDITKPLVLSLRSN